MEKQKLFLVLPFFLLPFQSSSQDFQVTKPVLVFDSTRLLISYDLINKNQADLFYIWVEMQKINNEPIRMKALSGDVGDNIKAGKNKKITWIPEKDSVFLNEEVFVEVKAEKYIKSFNKGSMMLLSAAIPGLGQTKISKGKPWWLTGVAAYGALVSGVIVHYKSDQTFSSYQDETADPLRRADLFNRYNKEMNISNALIVSGAALWGANIIWVALTPDKYQPLQHVKLSLDQSNGIYNRATLLTFRLDF